MQQYLALLFQAHRATFVRALLASLFTLSGIAFIGTLLNSAHPTAHASPSTMRETALPASLPWGLAFDKSNNVWVAEPGCDPAPACSPQVGR